MIISDSTVAAVSTPRAAGGISVIRISGDNAVDIADRIFTPLSSKKKPSEKKKAACAVTMAQAAYLPSGEFAEVVDKNRL